MFVPEKYAELARLVKEQPVTEISLQEMVQFAEKLEKRVDFGRIWWYPNKAA